YKSQHPHLDREMPYGRYTRPPTCSFNARSCAGVGFTGHQYRISAGTTKHVTARDRLHLAPRHQADEQCKVPGSKHKLPYSHISTLSTHCFTSVTFCAF